VLLLSREFESFWPPFFVSSESSARYCEEIPESK